MKNATRLAIVLFITGTLLSSCNKKYDCNCSWSSQNLGNRLTSSYSNEEVKAGSIRRAGEKCDELEKQLESERNINHSCKVY